MKVQNADLILGTAKIIKKKRRCNQFVVTEDGVISISLQTLTLVGSISLTIALFVFAYLGCKADIIPHHKTCNVFKNNDWPMISDVIALPMMDRVWCILTPFFCLTVQQTNIRAFYKKLDGICSPR